VEAVNLGFTGRTLDMNKEIEAFVKEYSNELEEGNAAIFAGAGLSIPAGYVNWRDLIRPLAEELGLDVDREEDLVSVTQYYYNENLGRGRINQILIEKFAQATQITENHQILAHLPITTFWTTNYDKLIEKALEYANKVPDVKHTVAQLARTMPRRDAVVYKMHGDIEHPTDTILTKDDYERYHIRMAPFISALSGDLVSKTFLFIGFSFTDPNIDYILSRVRIAYDDAQRRHYCFMKVVSQDETKTKDELEYKKLQQQFFVKDLRRFNIKTILLDQYSQITEALERVRFLYKLRSIFISGSACTFAPWSESKAQNFIYNLSKALAHEGHRIISGFGLGVGSAVINGVLTEIYSSPMGKLVNEQLVLRPFPQVSVEDMDLQELKQKYREEMIEIAGIGIFLFGNKLVEGEITDADGVLQEFEIAKMRGLKLFPIGATGYVAQRLWRNVLENIDEYHPNCSSSFKRNFELIGNSSEEPKEIIEALLALLKDVK
jgi:hypothetical protein